MSSNGQIELTRNESSGIATICIYNPKKRNAINDEMMEQLASVVSQLEDWPTGKAVIIFGKNGFFSSGVDLNFVRNNVNSLAVGYHYSQLMHSTLSHLQSLSLLTVGAVEGQALGGAAEILTACDLRLMTKSAKIGFVQIRCGVTTGWSGGTRLTRLLGSTKALDLLMSGRLLTAKEAIDLGFVTHLFEDFTTTDQLIDETTKWLQQYLNYDRDVLRGYKNCCLEIN